MNIVLDTCTLIWAVAQPDRLSATGRDALLDAAARIYVSPISCAELACAVARGRVVLDRHWKPWFRH